MQDDDSSPASTERFAVGRAGGSSTLCARLACAVLRPGLLLLLLAPGAMAIPASAAAAGAAQIVCPALLLDHECRAYKADLSSAPSADARDALKTHYEGLLVERERACYCNPERSWIRLSETAPDPTTTFRAQ
jgi:hypothetical protein